MPLSPGPLGHDVFDPSQMKAAVPKEVFKSVQKTIKEGGKLDYGRQRGGPGHEGGGNRPGRALISAHAFINHMTTAPLRKPTTASFQFKVTVRHIPSSPAKVLVQGRTPMVILPNGGIRSSLKARDTPPWDITSPCFLDGNRTGSTFCIPRCSSPWTGKKLLTRKTRLLRSTRPMNREEPQRLLKLIGTKNVAPVNSSCGAEQDISWSTALYVSLRPDLLLAGARCSASVSAKGSSFDDHYSAPSPKRVACVHADASARCTPRKPARHATTKCSRAVRAGSLL